MQRTLSKAQRREHARKAVAARYGCHYEALCGDFETRVFFEKPTEDLPDESERALTLDRVAELRRDAAHWFKMARTTNNPLAADDMRSAAADCIRAAVDTHIANIRRHFAVVRS